MRKLRVIEVAHVRVPGVAQDLCEYLKRTFSDVVFIEHPFKSSRDILASVGSRYTRYSNGRKLHSVRGIEIRGPEIVYWIKDVVTTFLWTYKNGHTYDVLISLDCLNAFAGMLLKWSGRVSHHIYYTIDLTESRFDSKILSWIYTLFDRIACSYADEVWSVSNAITELRSSHGYHTSIRNHKLVPIGVYPEDYHRQGIQRIANRIVYLGSLFRIMGVQLAIGAMREIRKKIPDAHLVIIGSGDYEHELKDLVRKYKIETYVSFIYHNARRLNIRELFRGTIGIAPYMDEPGSYKLYCDPTKIKEYFAAGLPVIVTRVPGNAETIHRQEMGIAVEYDERAFAHAVVSLLSSKKQIDKARKRMKHYIARYNWHHIFQKAFRDVITF